MQTHGLRIKHAVISGGKILLLVMVQHRQKLLLVVQDLLVGVACCSIAGRLPPLKYITGGLSTAHFQLRLGLLLLLLRWSAISLLQSLRLNIILLARGGLWTLWHVLALVIREHRAFIHALNYCF